MLVCIRAFTFRVVLTPADSVASRSKAWFCGRSHAGISGSNPAEDINVVCCQAFVSSTSRSLVQRNPAECAVSECDREISTMRRTWSCKVFCAIEKENFWPSQTQTLLSFEMSEITRPSSISQNTWILSTTTANTSTFLHLQYNMAHRFRKLQSLFMRVNKITTSDY